MSSPKALSELAAVLSLVRLISHPKTRQEEATHFSFDELRCGL
jgi:hypothetical protein